MSEATEREAICAIGQSIFARGLTAEAALSTTIERFRLPSGHVAFANVSNASLPGSVAPYVQGVFGLSDAVRLTAAGEATVATGPSRT